MRSLCLAFLCLTLRPAVAQGPPAPFSVEEAVTQAVRNNPRLSATVREVHAARSGVRSARALTNPELVFTPGLQVGGSDEELLVQQRLELNGTRAARAGIAGTQLRGAQARALVELRDLVAETKAAYYELARARELLALATDLQQTAEDFDRRIRRLVEEGRRPGIELAQTGIEVARARQQVTQGAGQALSAQAALNTLLGRPPAETIGPLVPLAFTAQTLDEEALTRQALANRADIVVEEAAAEGFRQEARLARAEGRPDLAPQFRAGSLTRGVNDTGIGIGITLPLFDWGSRRNRVRQAEESARAQADRTHAVRNRVRQEVVQAVARVRAAETIVTQYRQGILDQARRLLEASRTSLAEGQASILNVLEAQRTYRSVQTDYTNALVEHAESRAALERATGAVPADLLPDMRSERR